MNVCMYIYACYVRKQLTMRKIPDHHIIFIHVLVYINAFLSILLKYTTVTTSQLIVLVQLGRVNAVVDVCIISLCRLNIAL